MNRLVNAFVAGAKEVNQDVKAKVSFIGSFFDPPKAKEAALAQIEAGVDVIYAERFGVIEAAAEKGMLAISNMSDQSALAPDTVVTGPVWDMYPTVNHVIKLVKAGVFTAQDFGDSPTWPRAAPISRPMHGCEGKLPAEVKDMVAKRTQEIMDGNFRVDVDEGIAASRLIGPSRRPGGPLAGRGRRAIAREDPDARDDRSPP